MTAAVAPTMRSPTTPGTAIPATVWALVLAATSTVVGLIWDLSWHRSIGRDTFWTPAHLMVQFGAVLAGLSSGWLVLKTTFAGTPEERARSVRVWGFRAPLGTWVAIWGAIAMLSSAPFDDWWHNAYGLDTVVLSPPHVILILGITAIGLGAILLVLALQNRAGDPPRRSHGLLLSYGGGILLQNIVFMLGDYLAFANRAHSRFFYVVGAMVFPIVLIAVARASRLRWGATTAAAAYLAISLAMSWLLQQFPATPKLAPVFNPVTHMVAPPFPLLLIVPSVAVDLLVQRLRPGRDWQLSLLAGLAFLALFFVTQWFFAEFLLSPRARNFFFGADQWPYSSRLRLLRYRFWGQQAEPLSLAVAALCAISSARVGLWLGNWMSRVRR